MSVPEFQKHQHTEIGSGNEDLADAIREELGNNWQGPTGIKPDNAFMHQQNNPAVMNLPSDKMLLALNSGNSYINAEVVGVEPVGPSGPLTEDLEDKKEGTETETGGIKVAKRTKTENAYPQEPKDKPKSDGDRLLNEFIQAERTVKPKAAENAASGAPLPPGNPDNNSDQTLLHRQAMRDDSNPIAAALAGSLQLDAKEIEKYLPKAKDIIKKAGLETADQAVINAVIIAESTLNRLGVKIEGIYNPDKNELEPSSNFTDEEKRGKVRIGGERSQSYFFHLDRVADQFDLTGVPELALYYHKQAIDLIKQLSPASVDGTRPDPISQKKTPTEMSHELAHHIARVGREERNLGHKLLYPDLYTSKYSGTDQDAAVHFKASAEYVETAINLFEKIYEAVPEGHLVARLHYANILVTQYGSAAAAQSRLAEMNKGNANAYELARQKYAERGQRYYEEVHRLEKCYRDEVQWWADPK